MASTKETKSQARARQRKDPLLVQIHAVLKVRKGDSQVLTGRLLRECVAYRLEHGHNPPGVELEIVQWRNPGRKAPALREWKTGGQEAAWETLAGPLMGYAEGVNNEISISPVKVRKDKRNILTKETAFRFRSKTMPKSRSARKKTQANANSRKKRSTR